MASYSMGDFIKLKQDALTKSIQVLTSLQQRAGLTKLFKTVQQNEGTDVIKWRIWKDTRKLAKFNVRNAPARRHEGVGARQLTEALTRIFISMPIDEDVLLMIESPDDNPKQRAAAWLKKAQQELIDLGDNALEWAIWKYLTTGEIVIDQSDDPKTPMLRTLSFGVDPLHVAQNTSLDWSDSGSKILSDVASGESWGDILAIPEDDGYSMTEVYCNRNTNKYLYGNTEVQALFSDATKDRMISRAKITRLDGADVETYNRKWMNDEGTELTTFIPDDFIVAVPEEGIRNQLFTLQEGECMVPDQEVAGNKLVKRMGRQSWVAYSGNPPAAELFYMWNVVPVILDPDCFVARNVVPAA